MWSLAKIKIKHNPTLFSPGVRNVDAILWPEFFLLWPWQLAPLTKGRASPNIRPWHKHLTFFKAIILKQIPCLCQTEDSLWETSRSLVSSVFLHHPNAWVCFPLLNPIPVSNFLNRTRNLNVIVESLFLFFSFHVLLFGVDSHEVFLWACLPLQWWRRFSHSCFGDGC